MTIPRASNIVPGILRTFEVVEGEASPAAAAVLILRVAVGPRLEAGGQVADATELRAAADDVGQMHDREVLHVDRRVVEELPLARLVVDDAGHRRAVEG